MGAFNGCVFFLKCLKLSCSNILYYQIIYKLFLLYVGKLSGIGILMDILIFYQACEMLVHKWEKAVLPCINYK